MLRFCYFPINVTRLGELFGVNTQPMTKLACTPELVNLVPAATSPRTIVYPDPPLGRHEIDLLAACYSNSHLTTPMFLLANSGRVPARQPHAEQRRLLIGMSLSPTNQKQEIFSAALLKLGFSLAHFDDAVYELARYLLTSGFNLAYGGDLRPGGFTECLHGLARQYGERLTLPVRATLMNLRRALSATRSCPSLRGGKTRVGDTSNNDARTVRASRRVRR